MALPVLLGKLDKEMVTMITFYNQYKGGDYSQNGEAGIIDECLKRMKKSSGVAIEFGAPTKSFCSNIFHLGPGWQKTYYDISPNDPDIITKTITPDNINEIGDCDILSIDIDGNDYNVWEAYNFSPDIVIIEINSSVHPLSTTPVSDLNIGTGYRAMVELGIEKGYTLLCHTGNLIFIHNKFAKLFPEIVGNGLNFSLYFNDKWL